MARTQAVKNYKNLLKGFLTEGNEFDEVDGAIRSGSNLIIQRTGGVRRRYGLDKENTVTADLSVTASGGGTAWSSSIYDWNVVNGLPGYRITLVQIGLTINFYKKGVTSNLLDNHINSVTLTAYPHYSGTAENMPIKFVEISGYILAVGEAIYPTFIRYSAGSFITSNITMKWRDFIGDYSDPGLFPDTIENHMTPSGVQFTGASSAAFTSGEQILGSGGANFYILYQDTSQHVYVSDGFISPSVAPVPGEALTGTSSGATATVSYLSLTANESDHFQNLYNQGWSVANRNAYSTAYFGWPSNTQIWSAGKDSAGAFSPADLVKIDFGNTPAPRGKVLMNAVQPFDRQPFAENSTYSTSMPTAIGSFSSRVFIGGWNYDNFANWIFFSPIVDTASGNTTVIGDQIGNCYQKNDPTSDYQSALLADDGGVIVVPEMGRQIAFISLEKALIVICDNGVWIITGTANNTGFTADSYSVNRISEVGTTSINSIVVVENETLFWNEGGIYSISPGTIPGKYITKNITRETIHTFFSDLTGTSKKEAIGYYDASNNIVRWAYQGDSSLTNGKYHDSELILDMKLKCFYPPTRLSSIAAYGNVNLNPFIIGYTQDKDEPGLTGFPVLKAFILKHNTSGGTISGCFAAFTDDTFTDFAYLNGSYFSSTFEMWPDHVGDPVRDKQSKWVYFYFKKTEDGFVDNGSGGLIAKHQSSCKVTAKYQWHITSTSGKWSGPFQAYKFNRPYVPVDVNDTFDTGESILVTKLRFKGRGKALTLGFASEDGKDLQLLGVSIPYTAVFTT